MSASPGESRREPSSKLGPRGPRDPRIGKEIAGRYRILSVLGSGGLGTVYRAEDPRVGRAVAVKLLLDDFAVMPELKRRFEREAQALGALAHPNIVNINDSGVSDGMPFIVMELLEGMTLEHAIEKAPLEPARAMDILRQILRGLAYAHGKGIAHRDLKPANIFLQALPDQADHVRLLDFGLARFVDHEKTGEATLTQAGTVFGSPAYMTPEQAAGGRADARADVYAAGIVAFEMLAGRRPFVADTRPDLFRAHMLDDVPDATKLRPGLLLSPGLVKLIEKALAKTADARFPDAGAMLAALDALPPDAARLDPSLSPAATAIEKPIAPTIREREPDITVKSGHQRGEPTGGVEIKRRPRSRWPRLLALLAVVAIVVVVVVAVMKAHEHAMPAIGSGGDGSSVVVPVVADAGARVRPFVPPTPHPGHPPVPTLPTVPTVPTVPTHPAVTPDAGVVGPAVPGTLWDPWAAPLPTDLAAQHARLVAHQIRGADIDPLQSLVRRHNQDARYQLLYAQAFTDIGHHEDPALERYRQAILLDARVVFDPRTISDVSALCRARGEVARDRMLLQAIDRQLERTEDPLLRQQLTLLRAPLAAAVVRPAAPHRPTGRGGRRGRWHR